MNGHLYRLQRGERLGLVGESGCGNLTLTRALLGLEPVHPGSINTRRHCVYSAPTQLCVRRKMQVVFQERSGSFNPRTVSTG